jgi:hypothetical protein
MTNPDPLAIEKQFLARETPGLVERGHHGCWAVVSGETLIGVYVSPSLAYAAGVAAVGATRQFLIAQVDDRPAE